MEYYSAIKKNENFAICSNMDGLSIICNEISQTQEKQKLHDITYMQDPKNTTNQ